MRRADQITGTLMLIFSVVVMEGARRMPPSNTFGPGAGFLPFWLGAAMAHLLRHPAGQRDPGAGPGLGRLPVPRRGERSSPSWKPRKPWQPSFFSLETLGFRPAIALLTAFLLRIVERVAWPTTVTVAVANSVGLYVVFQILLGVSLPKNILGF